MRLRGALILTLFVLAACAALPAAHYYTLSSGTFPSFSEAGDISSYRLAIGPATVPLAVDRPQIMLSIASGRYAISDSASWSAPLKREIPRVIAEVVARSLPKARVAAYEQHGGQDADYGVLIDVLRFDSVPSVSVTLEVVWTLRGRNGERLREMRSVFVEPVTTPGIAPLVAAHNKALTKLGGEIARTVDQQRKAQQ